MGDIIADLHTHSRFAMACSKFITLDKLEEGAKIKGLNLLGTSDFTHPLWHKEIKEKLVEDEDGILWSKNKFPFLWQTEISLVYTQGHGRRVHHLILAPNGEVVDQINEALLKKGRLDYDGRPIFGFSSIELVEMMRSISHDIEIIPAHAWTSWFAVFGSKSGFDSLKDCFQEKTKHIHAIETGMSSDPAMNRRISFLDGINMVSFSDMHSHYPWRIGREATVFSTPLIYKKIVEAIRTGDGLKSTVETSPEYGKYHFDGHRNCNVFLEPEESKRLNRICPTCKKPLTIGVAYRIEELADRPADYVDKNMKPYYTLIPLTELVAFVHGISMLSSKKVWETYNKLIHSFGNEYRVLMDVSFGELKDLVGEKLAKLIIMNREGKLEVKPGYDGVYGAIVLQERIDRVPGGVDNSQKSLGDF